jgi:hypothetical protein
LVAADAVATYAEREASVGGYAALAGYATAQVNSRKRSPGQGNDDDTLSAADSRASGDAVGW